MLPGATVTAADRQKILENAAVALAKALFKDTDGAEDLVDLVHELFQKVREGFPVDGADVSTVVDKLQQLLLLKVDDKKKPKVDATVSAVVAIVSMATGTVTTNAGIKALETSVTSLAKEVGGKDAATLTKQLILLVHLAAGDLTDAQKQALFEEALVGLLERTLFNGILDAPFLQAFLEGYEFAAPFGARMADDLKHFTQTQVSGQAQLALEHASPSWLTDVVGGRTVTTTIQSGSFGGWSVTAFWDHTVDDIRLQVVSPAGTVWLLDKHGNDVTGEGQAKAIPTDGATRPEEGGPNLTKVAPVVQYAEHHGDTPAKKQALDGATVAVDDARTAYGTAANAHAAAVQALRDAQTALDDIRHHTTATTVVQKYEDDVARARAAVDAASGPAADAWRVYNARYHDYFVARKAYDDAMKAGIAAGAVMEGWTREHYEFLARYWPQWSVPVPSPAAPATPGGAGFPVGVGGRTGGAKYARRVNTRAIVVGALTVMVVVALGLGIVLTRGGGGDTAPRARAASNLSRAAANPVSPSPARTAPSVPSSSPGAPPPLVSGAYAGTVAVAPGRDPAGHACCVKPADRWDVLQTRDPSTGAITIALGHVLEGIDLSGPLDATGAPFTAVGTGTVAGYPNTSVEFTGTVTPGQGLHGTLTVGANGSLPTGRSITYQVDFTKSP